MKFDNNVPFGHKNNSNNGIAMCIGDNTNHKCKLIFPVL